MSALFTALLGLPLFTPPPQAAGEEKPAPPAYSFLRQAEDWSKFRAPEQGGDFFDPIKHVSLSDDGDVWISFGGRLEARVEVWDDFDFTDAFDDTFLLTRALGHADLHVGEDLRVFVEGKTAQATDRDLPGGRRPIDLDTLALQQAFADFTWRIADGALRLRPGRQMLLFGAQRLVSPLPWGNTLRTWDGVTLECKRGPWTVTGLATAFAPVQKTDFNDVDEDTTLYGVYARHKLASSVHGYEIYALGNERSNVMVNGTSGDEDRVTLGTRLFGNPDVTWDYDVELSYQTGEVGDGDVSAWSAAAQVGWKPRDVSGAPRIWLGLDAASGDDEAGGDVGTFHQLFPLGHAYFGYIDAIGRQNILDASTGASVQVAEATNVSAALHSFHVLETSDALYNAGGAPSRTGFDSRDVGLELDLVANHRFDRHTSLHAGVSRFFAGSAIEESGSSEDITFAYLAAQFTF